MNSATESNVLMASMTAKPSIPRRLRLVISLAMSLPCSNVAFALDPTLPRPGRKPVPASTAAPADNSSLPSAVSMPATKPASRPSRLPVPDQTAQASAGKLVDQVYRDPIAAARTADQKKALGQRFLKAASETSNDPAGKYVLLVRARDIAADAGDVDTTLASIDETDRVFEVERGAADEAVIARLQRNIRAPEQSKVLAKYLLGATTDAVGQDRYEAARRYVDQAATVAARANDLPLARWAQARAKEVREAETAFIAAKAAIAATEKGPADPASNLAAGRYRCLFKGDWAGGLPLLAAGSDAALKELAAKELASKESSDSADADARLAIADGWWNQSSSLQGLPKNISLAHARIWYERAEPSLTGLSRDKAAQRMKESEQVAVLYGPTKAPAGASPNVPATTVVPTVTPPVGPTDPAPAAPVRINLPPQFTREWKSPALWVGKPEQVVIKDGKVTITNEGGSNSVCKDATFVPQKDGTLVLQWDYGQDKSGYEVWEMKDNVLVIERWNSKAEKDGGRPARRIGSLSGK